ncbi:hypothetical protein ACROYT_G034527 [Oculina patagonica]
MGPSMLVTISLGVLICFAGTTLLVAGQVPQWPPRPGDEAEISPEESLVKGYQVEIKPLKSNLEKRLEFKSSIGTRNFIRGEKPLVETSGPPQFR